jgi:hypothetical protein
MHTCDNTLASRQCQLSQALKGLLYCTDRECLAAACRSQQRLIAMVEHGPGVFDTNIRPVAASVHYHNIVLYHQLL